MIKKNGVLKNGNLDQKMYRKEFEKGKKNDKIIL